jgi:hypothetical protein
MNNHDFPRLELLLKHKQGLRKPWQKTENRIQHVKRQSSAQDNHWTMTRRTALERWETKNEEL